MLLESQASKLYHNFEHINTAMLPVTRNLYYYTLHRLMCEKIMLMSFCFTIPTCIICTLHKMKIVITLTILFCLPTHYIGRALVFP